MTEYMVSVLITFYNQERYVDECLESVFSQETTFPFKVIIGDDGSTDGTLDKIKEWKKRYPDRLQYLVMSRKEGESYVGGTRASRNRLAILDCVDTKYFQYLDGDDYWTDKNKLQMQFDILEKEENKDCVGCAHAIVMFHEKKSSEIVRLPRKGLREGKYDLRQYWKNLYFHTDTIMFKSENIKKLPRVLIEDSFNDNLITFCFMKFGALYYFDKEMAAYRQNDDGIWAGEKKIVSQIRELILDELELKINPQLTFACKQRHLRNFLFLHKNRKQINGLEAYYEIAEKYELSLTKNVITNQLLFTSSYCLDGIIIALLMVCYKIIEKIVSRLKKV